MKNTILELKKTVEGIKNRFDEPEDQISELEDKVEKNTQKDQEKENRLRKNEDGLRVMQDNMKHKNIHTIGILEGEEEKQGVENMFEKVMMEHFPHLMREKVTQTKKHRESPKRGTQRGPLQDTS